MEDGTLGSDEAIVMDKAAVTRQFEIGYQVLGAEFAKGDSKSSCIYLISVSMYARFSGDHQQRKANGRPQCLPKSNFKHR